VKNLARKFSLPYFLPTEIAEGDLQGAASVRLPDGSSYSTRPRCAKRVGRRVQDSPRVFQTFPIIVRGCGIPWDEANLYLFELVDGWPDRHSATVHGTADDLVSFLRFVEENEIDWSEFPAHKLTRPTYRYRGYLMHEIWAGRLKASTAKRRMHAVIKFYRWLMEKGLMEPENPPWKEVDAHIRFASDFGQTGSKLVKVTDLRIGTQTQDDPFAETIEDGGKLRPLPHNEQKWLIEALCTLGNTEMLLIHLFALLTGARIQTVLTFKLRPELAVQTRENHVLYAVGPGTGIDSKNGKKMVLHIPTWFYEVLMTYEVSKRSRIRRNRSLEGVRSGNLFLTVHGAPMYDGVLVADERIAGKRHRRNGQAVRQYMRDYIVPYVRAKYAASFTYQFHDLRATFGLNLCDSLASKLSSAKVNYTTVLNLVRSRMCHASLQTTERYVRFRADRRLAEAVQGDWEHQIQLLTNRALEAGIA
jgi:hypothetical protein